MLINCDLGEWESDADLAWMMKHIKQANVACGFHAGSIKKMILCKELADEYNVQCGMHPGVKGEKGRGNIDTLSVCEFYDLLEAQYLQFEKYSGKPTHVKLHGSLYHLSEAREDISKAYIDFAGSLSLPIIALATGAVQTLAEESQIKCYAEGFIDRNYHADGSLVSRSESNAELSNEDAIWNRVEHLQKEKGIVAVDGAVLSFSFDTLCVHSDSPLSKYALDLLA